MVIYFKIDGKKKKYLFSTETKRGLFVFSGNVVSILKKIK